MLKTETVGPSFIGSEIEVGGVGMAPVPPPSGYAPAHRLWTPCLGKCNIQ